MSFVPQFLNGLVSVEQLSFETGIRMPQIVSYLNGSVSPRSGNLKKLQESYITTQTRRLENAGFGEQQQADLLTLTPSSINKNIARLDSAVKRIADRVNEGRLSEGKDPLDDVTFRDAMRGSDKTYVELFNSP